MDNDVQNDLRAIRAYWEFPTMGARAKETAPGLVEFAQLTINNLCNEIELLRGIVAEVQRLSAPKIEYGSSLGKGKPSLLTKPTEVTIKENNNE